MYKILSGALMILAITGGRAKTQTPTVDPESLAGFWETSSTGTVTGIFLSFTHFASFPDTTPDLLKDIRRTLQVLVRHPGSWGWYSGPGDFDGRRLKVAGFDLSFQPEQRRWVGTLTSAGQVHEVVLERPRSAPEISRHALVGDWTAEQDPTETLKQGGHLHIAQSSDGTVSAWMDRFLAPWDERRYGELIDLSIEDDEVRLLLTQYVTGPVGEFRGILSGDRSRITGGWFRNLVEIVRRDGQRLPRDTWKLNAPTIFVRVP